MGSYAICDCRIFVGEIKDYRLLQEGVFRGLLLYPPFAALKRNLLS